jgi:hypothetical protein
MAEHWIKIEKTTPDKPEIFEMADILDVDPDEILGKLIRVWAWMDSQFDEMSANCPEKNGQMSVFRPLDRVAGVKGFADAMKKVGWLEDGCIPNFDRHLGESAKKRAKDAERKKMSRINADKRPQSVTKKVGPEEEEEEDKKRTKRLMSENKFSDRDTACAENIYQRVLVVAPHTKKPNFEKWADTIRLMREQDKISHEQIWRVFDFANRDDFWRTNILGPDKLRKQFAQLDAKMNSVPTSQTRQQQIQEKSFDAIDAWEPNHEIQ